MRLLIFIFAITTAFCGVAEYLLIDAGVNRTQALEVTMWLYLFVAAAFSTFAAGSAYQYTEAIMFGMAGVLLSLCVDIVPAALIIIGTALVVTMILKKAKPDRTRFTPIFGSLVFVFAEAFAPHLMERGWVPSKQELALVFAISYGLGLLCLRWWMRPPIRRLVTS